MVCTVHNWRAVFSTPVQYWAGLSPLSRAASDPPQYHNIIAQCQSVCVEESNICAAAGVGESLSAARIATVRKLEKAFTGTSSASVSSVSMVRGEGILESDNSSRPLIMQ